MKYYEKIFKQKQFAEGGMRKHEFYAFSEYIGKLYLNSLGADKYKLTTRDFAKYATSLR